MEVLCFFLSRIAYDVQQIDFIFVDQVYLVIFQSIPKVWFYYYPTP